MRNNRSGTRVHLLTIAIAKSKLLTCPPEFTGGDVLVPLGIILLPDASSENDEYRKRGNESSTQRQPLGFHLSLPVKENISS